MAEPDFYSGIKSSDNTYMSRDEVFGALEEQGVDRAVVHFSGGHDEGGADAIHLERFISEAGEAGADEAGANEAEDSESLERVAKLREHVWPEGRGLTANEKWALRLAQSLAAPIYDAYYGFAGEFYVEGTLVWDVAARRVSMSGQESVERHEDFDNEI